MLSAKVLILDKAYMPVDVVGWMKAMELLVSGKAEVVEEYEDVEIRSTSASWRLPCVMRLAKYFNKKRTVKFSRFNVFFRDKWTCQYCGQKKPTEELTFDHVTPRCRKTPESFKSWENIVTACFPCNQRKAGRTPREAGMRLLREPYKPKWTPAMTIRLKASDPEAWRTYFYWHGALQEG